MALLIGMDEAGYGPNLGPLVIGATAWEVPGDPRKVDLWKLFSGVVEQTAPENASHIQIADSKQVFSPATGLKNLEAGVFSALAVWRSMANSDDRPGSNGESRRYPRASVTSFGTWRFVRRMSSTANRGLPGPIIRSKLRQMAHLPKAGSTAVAVTGFACGPSVPTSCSTRRFNEETRRNDSKGRALSEMSMHFLRHVWQTCEGDGHDSALILADKHGGRNRYHEFLPIVFGDRFIRCHKESMEQSRYRVGQAEIRFETKSERHLPVALASMVSKYLRELAMILFNRFWTERQAGLKKTAGYPTDALRFKADIAATQKQLGIDDEILWRER